MEKEEKLLNYQLITSIAFIVSLIISIILTYDEKKELLNEETIFSKDFDKYLNLFNRILALSIVCFILYINYETYKINKNKKTDIKPFEHQIIASVLSIISAIIVLYVVIENWESIPSITNIENPTV